MSFEPLTVYLAMEVEALRKKLHETEEREELALNSFHSVEDECRELAEALQLADEARDMMRGQAILMTARVRAVTLKNDELKDKVANANIRAMVAERDLKARNLQLEEMTHKWNMERLRKEEMMKGSQPWVQKKRKVFVWTMPKVEKMD